MNGIPLTVNPVQGDFGFNWTYAINDMDVIIDEAQQFVPARGQQQIMRHLQAPLNGWQYPVACSKGHE